ncbi:hypothetical protein B5S33_g4219 [[Candida] boidinii]|nr:hypothetical protein B5S33_g4219 [[Candida] boidinii]
MSLFEIEGWGLENKKIALSNESSKPSKNQQKKASRKGKLKEKNETKDIKDVKDVRDIKDKKLKKDKKEKKEKTNDSIDKKRKIDQVDPVDQQQEETKSEDTRIIKNTKKLTPLQEKMMFKLSGSRFRWINEQLYTITSQDAMDLIKEQPNLFDEYHNGFRSQVESWPENPVDNFVNKITNRAKTRIVNAPGGLPGLPTTKEVVIADMGCGEAQLAYDIESFLNKVKSTDNSTNSKKNGKKFNNKRNSINFKNLQITVHSFDLKKINDKITVADIKNVPLADESCTIVIFCLSLMGTNFLDFIKEAYRILAPRGELWISEIKSRLSDTKGEEFIEILKKFGFYHKTTNDSNKMFTEFEFFKPPMEIIKDKQRKLSNKQKFIDDDGEDDIDSKRLKNPEGNWLLKPCIYKRR